MSRAFGSWRAYCCGRGEVPFPTSPNPAAATISYSLVRFVRHPEAILKKNMHFSSHGAVLVS
jgi:hypothetical protein